MPFLAWLFLGNTALKFIKFSKRKFQISILFSLRTSKYYDTFGHFVGKILQTVVHKKNFWSTRKAMQSIQSAITPRILTLTQFKVYFARLNDCLIVSSIL